MGAPQVWSHRSSAFVKCTCSRAILTPLTQQPGTIGQAGHHAPSVPCWQESLLTIAVSPVPLPIGYAADLAVAHV